MAINLNTAFDLPNQKAIDYFINKKVVEASAMRELGVSAHAKAFTLANINNLNLLQDFKNSLEKALKEGQGFAAWRSSLLDVAKAKGWTNGADIFDAQTGVIIQPHRMATIFHTNLNGAFAAGRYQSQMENVVYQPIWEYVAVGDSLTRPFHAELSGTAKRYDDPFWLTFYPPIDYRCRCTVVARSEDYMDEYNKQINETDVEVDEEGNTYFKPSFDKIYPRKSFAYNQGRHGFRPNLDDYDPALAQQFSVADMSSPEFKMQYQRLEKEILAETKRLDVDQLNGKQSKAFQDKNQGRILFAAGIMPADILEGQVSRTVWFSDASMIKQVNSRIKDVKFGVGDYAALPNLINNTDTVAFVDDMGDAVFMNDKYYAVVKSTAKGELILKSMRFVGKNDAKKVNQATRFK